MDPFKTHIMKKLGAVVQRYENKRVIYERFPKINNLTQMKK